MVTFLRKINFKMSSPSRYMFMIANRFQYPPYDRESDGKHSFA